MSTKFLYRLYDENNVYLRCCETFGYEEAKILLKPNEFSKIFIVEEDNHEVECGLAWIEELLK